MTNLTYSNTTGSLGDSVKRTDLEYRSPEAVNVQGLFELPRDGHVSSLALTPDGCYVFAGFGGGEVRMYAQALNTVGAASRSGTLVAQIRSKGMFSNTKVECYVEASEDGRFVFAGMLRGSSEMLALDINDLPRWSTLPTTEGACLAASEYDLNRRIRTYAHSDGKLKGFGAAAIVRTGPDRSRWGDEYRLFCGRGVKNIHVWSFKPAYAAMVVENGGSDKLGEGSNGGTRAGSGSRSRIEWGSGGEWTCLYDTHTNGATVELVAFRNGGLEGISKSTDANVRVWDLSGDNNPAKPPFRDVSNSKDTRAVFGDFAYGGATALSLVKIDEPAAANRMEIGLPESGMNAQTGRSMVSSTRGKRHCRMLKDLAGTQDGRHVVMVCSDGTVLYHRHTREATMLKLRPLEGLGFEEETRPTVALTLVGRYGLPVLMIAGERGRCTSAGPGGEEAGKMLELMALPFGSARDLDGLQARKVYKWYGDWAPLGPWPEGRRLSMKDEKSSDEDEDGGDDNDDEDEDDDDDDGDDEEDGEDEGEDNGENERLEDGDKGSCVVRKGISSRKRDRCDTRGPPTARELVHHEGRRKVSREGSPGDGMDGAGERKVREGLDVKADPEAPKASRRNLGGGSIEAHRRHMDRTGHEKSLAGVGSANDHPDDGALGDKIVGVKTSPDSAFDLPPPRVSTPMTAWIEKSQSKDEGLERANDDDDPSEDDSDDDSVEADDDVGVGRRKEGFNGLGTTYITPVASPSVGSESSLPAPVHGSNWSSGSTSRKRGPRGGEECPRELSSRASNDDSAATERSPKEDYVAEGSGSRNVERHTTPACLTSHGLNIAAVANLSSNGSGASLADFSAPKPRGSAEKSALGDLAAAAAAALAAATGGNLSESEDAAEGGGKDGEVSGLGDRLESSRRSGSGPTRLYYGHEKRDDIVKRDLFHPFPQPEETADGGRFLGSSAKNDFPFADSSTPVKPSSLLEDAHEKHKKQVNGAGVAGESGPGPGPGGRCVASAKRMGRKRIRDDWEKLSTGDDEGDKVESTRSIKARRGGSHTKPDDVGAVGERGNASTGASAVGQPDRFPLRDRRSRIAARVLRSSGSPFDLGALTKGVGAGGAAWTGDGEQQVERLSVVRISESDVGVVPAPVPAALASFLEMHQDRRRREMAPVSLEQARARYGSCAARPPGEVTPFGGGTAVAKASGLDRGANTKLDGQIALEATGDSGVESSLPKLLAKSASGGSEGSALPGSVGCVGWFPNGKEESSSRRADDDVRNDSQHQGSTAGAPAVASTSGVVSSSSEDVGKDRDASRDAGSRQSTTDTPGQVTCVAGAVALVSKEQDCGNAAAPPSIAEEVQQAHTMSKGLACGESTGKLMSVLAWSKHPGGDHMEKGGEEEQELEGGPEVFPPPMEAVIEMRERAGDRGSGGGAIDRLYSAHCLEREAAARVFFEEQDRLRRRFQSAVDVLELDNAVESAGLGLRSGCRTVQTLKMRLKSCWKEGCRGNEVHRCKSKEAHQATQRFQEQMRHLIKDHNELLRDVLGRQRLEASALQMSQEMEVTRGNAPLLQVRSAFPGMFEEVARRHHIFL